MSTGAKKKSLIRLSFSYLLLIAIAVCVLYPTIWIVMSSIRPGTSLFSDSLIPSNPTFEHYVSLFTSKEYQYGLWYLNTLKIATFNMIFGVILVVMTAYALSRFRFYGRKNLMSGMLVLGMFPGFMSMIAIYILLMQLNLLDTHFALILVYSAGAPLGAFVVKGFFDTIPKSLEESARIDGATHWIVFRKIMLPLSKPMITYVGLMTFAGAWGDFIFARLVLRSKENYTLAIGLWDMVNNASTNFTMFAAGAVLIAVPIALLYLFLQRFLVEGLTAGASKG
ncbi:sugar ABC transporter permease [Paenibacillus sp. MER 180]|jgi:arabinogalactan oligomer / maltooligosaccharide transport system permease protein|uniref:Sugar ABC transporter permease n=3 Tax=Paenibacillus TaxID=44249 RepID=A0AAJ2N7N3_9BACL|nr:MULTISPECIES: sugar ABC transporter permease [Paenibacillus]EPY09428.1 binding-protein-dependent transporters inner membrane component [Paenibacillus alvei A6-6i-x]MCM3294155.1 sugar ABC transporter permease [Paenibacillus sp. MER 180]MCY9528580.1 sugar ABC transporter permease [Paenibacillus alvei]MDT8979755.1 sugar ABC transporter permease [Paenibacillus sp. chi10]TQR43684.1 sugar ABC transporter permease [Paenibacillus sp. SDF0028]